MTEVQRAVPSGQHDMETNMDPFCDGGQWAAGGREFLELISRAVVVFQESEPRHQEVNSRGSESGGGRAENWTAPPFLPPTLVEAKQNIMAIDEPFSRLEQPERGS
ncbi:hypothetical protein AMECASPLE_022713 [Ameca splendens]|uniref:Uncharacterized protein n=1 Tax=Ameca splendens TaxID=208324 RepID=A0ABV0ZRG7_9TELE